MGKRRKLPNTDETAVLTESTRRCAVCFGLHADTKVKEGQIAHLDRDPSNNALDNLAWLCLFHHAQFDTRSNTMKGFTLEEVRAYRASLYARIKQGALTEHASPVPPTKPSPTFNTSAGNGSTVINAARDVTYRIRAARKSLTIAPPSDAIGSNIEMRSYMEYLTKRYIDWRQMAIDRRTDRRRFFPGMLHRLIEKEFGSRVNLVPQSRFNEVVAFIQNAIDNTIWGRKSPHRNYHSFKEHCAKVHGTSADSLELR